MTDRMERGWARGCLMGIGVLALMAAAAGAAFVGAGWYMKKLVTGPDPVTVANSSLQGLREQNRLSTFQNREPADYSRLRQDGEFAVILLHERLAADAIAHADFDRVIAWRQLP